MNPAIHKLSGRFCPFCLLALHQVVTTGFEFCPGNPGCDYEVRPGADQTAPLTQPERVEQVLKNKQREHSLMLKRLGELQVHIDRLTGELTALGFPPPAGGFDFVVEQFHDEKGWIPIPGCTYASLELAVAGMEHRERHLKQRDMQVVKVGVVTELVRRDVRELVRVGLPGVATPFRTSSDVNGAGDGN